MLILLALAAGLGSAPSDYDALAPALVRVTTSFRCGAIEHAISVTRAAAGDRIESVTINGRRIPTVAFSQIQSAFTAVDRIDEVRPLCAQGPDRILVKGRSASKKRSLMIFFGPNNQVAVREVG